MKERIDFKKA